jgi:NAD(P)-dependent dehydrogenase (short-subunit alcohol dehydrogenase family)
VVNPSGWVSELNELDLLVNCAGINHNEWFEDVSFESLEQVMEVNAFGMVYMTQACLHALKNSRGTVINIVSNAAHIPMTSSLAYNMSKAAALMATKQMAHELTPKYGITVFSVSPNKLRGTGMSKQIEENVCKVRGWTPEYAAEYQKKSLMHGLETEPRDVADFIANLVTTGQSKFMSGCDIPFGK